MAFENNYTLGRGELYFARRDAATGLLGGFRYIGNTPEVNLTAEEEKLEHFSSDKGIRVKDATVSLQVNYTGTVSCDNVDADNVALFFLGTSEQLTVAQSTVTGERINDVEKGMFYQLGLGGASISGARNVIYPGAGGTAFTVAKVGTPNVPLVHGTDYVLNAALGRVELLDTATAITNGDDMVITYTVAASTRTRVISGSTAIQGALQYIAYNPEGKDRDFLSLSVTLSPNGDFPLKADEWQVIPFNLDITKLNDATPAIVWDERAV